MGVKTLFLQFCMIKESCDKSWRTDFNEPTRQQVS